MGALTYEPENPNSATNLPTDLDEIDYEIQATLEENDAYIDDLLILGGSSAGARPKVALRIHNEDWLIKFKSCVKRHAKNKTTTAKIVQKLSNFFMFTLQPPHYFDYVRQ
jgi:hypothetical protein